MNLDELWRSLLDEPITYRQLDYWLRTYPHLFTAPAAGVGSGYHRKFTDTDLARLRRIARLVDAGLKPAAAASIAAGEGQYQRLSAHVLVRVTA